MHKDDSGRNSADDIDDQEDEVIDQDARIEDDPGDTVVLSEADYSDNVGDISVEINVEELVAKVESESDRDAARKKEIRRRLEDLDEEKNFEDTYAIDFDKD